MSGFLLYWLLGESIYSMSTGLSLAELGLMADMLEAEAVSQLEAERTIKPRERERLRRICVAVVMTVFFLLPLLWPMILMPDDDDDLLW